MGIKDFTKVFAKTQSIKYASLNTLGINKICIDAMNLIHRASTWSKASTFTDNTGQSTSYIMVILASIKKIHKLGIKMIWVFDYNKDKLINGNLHLPLKEKELQARKLRREKAKAEISILQKHKKELLDNSTKKVDQLALVSCAEQLFSDTEHETSSDNDSKDRRQNELKALEKSIQCKSRQTFTLDSQIISDVKFILDSLNIPWIEASAGFEGEQLCACLTNTGLNDGNLFGKCDAVLTDDVDCLIYGARIMLKRADKRKKKVSSDSTVAQKTKRSASYDFDMFNLSALHATYNISQDDLIKIGVILGCDLADKTPGIGIKTVLKRFKDIELTEEQQKAVDHFKLKCPLASSIVFHNIEKDINISIKHNKLIAWLESKKMTSKFTSNLPMFV